MWGVGHKTRRVNLTRDQECSWEGTRGTEASCCRTWSSWGSPWHLSFSWIRRLPSRRKSSACRRSRMTFDAISCWLISSPTWVAQTQKSQWTDYRSTVISTDLSGSNFTHIKVESHMFLWIRNDGRLKGKPCCQDSAWCLFQHRTPSSCWYAFEGLPSPTRTGTVQPSACTLPGSTATAALTGCRAAQRQRGSARSRTLRCHSDSCSLT